MTNKIIEAWNAQADHMNQWDTLSEDEKLAWAYRQALEDAAKVAEDYCEQYKKTKEAHERLSMEPFRPERFGFWPDRLHQSQKISDAIRALKEQQHG